mgnify:CR=1 FL=1|tara:strand:+ start:228 stop:1133 length:906 start_codon:yes stop_codon:yes gene_type:complete
MIIKFVIKEEYNNTRLDRWFKKEVINLPQSLIEKHIRKNKIKINNRKIKSNYRLKTKDLVEIYDVKKFKENKSDKTKKYTPKLSELKIFNDLIIDDNENFLVINKPAGLPVQGGTKSFKNLIDILSKSEYFKSSKPFVVHRIDKETSGLLLIAKNRKYAQLFTSLFRIRKIHKTYITIVHGEFSKHVKKIENNLITYENKRKLIQKAISHVKVLKTSNHFSLLEVNPLTGRKHQIRRQLLIMGNPVVGDNKYFIQRDKYNSMFLHAYKIKFIINNIKYNFKANYNKTFETFLNSQFKKDSF